MDIKKAIARIEELVHRIERGQAAIVALQKEGDSCLISYDSYFLMAPKGELTRLAKTAIEKDQKELEKLQGVIAMANAALKGVLSDER